MILSTKKDHPQPLALAAEAYRVLDEDLREQILARGDSIKEHFPHFLFAHAKELIEKAKEADAALYPDHKAGDPIILLCDIVAQEVEVEDP